MLALEAEFYVEQCLVGWMIGKAGATLKEIEHAYQVKIAVDQSTKNQGYSKVKIGGAASFVQLAAEHVNNSLARASVGSNSVDGSETIGPFLLDAPPGDGPDTLYEEMHIDQRYVGWLLGKSGGVIREIEQASGCKVSINQESRNQGFSKAQLHGVVDERAHARQLILNSLERAQAMPGSGDRGGCGNGFRHMTEEGMQVEQKYVGYLLGRSGGLAKEIEQESGARVTIDQSTKSQGYSMVLLSGEVPQVESAKLRVVASLQKVGGMPMQDSGSSASYGRFGGGGAAGDAVTEVQIDQQWVGWLLGKGGQVVKEIEAATGAKVSMNQETKPLGYSIATLKGNSQQVSLAYEHISDKLRRVNHSGDGPVIISQVGGQASPFLGRAPAINLAPQANRLSQFPPRKPPLTNPAAVLGGGAAAPSTGGVLGSSLELHVEQLSVDWLLGKGDQALREIEAMTGAKVSVDQSTRVMGYSIVKVVGSALGVQLAQQRIQAVLSSAAPCDAPADRAGLGGGLVADEPGEEMQVQQKWVGWLLGKSGVVLKEIELQSGASVKIDQSTKDMGYSTVRIEGDWQQSAIAQRLIQDKISQANG